MKILQFIKNKARERNNRVGANCNNDFRDADEFYTKLVKERNRRQALNNINNRRT
ncbi:MAG: hypothetical protein E7H54_04475 [Clostridium perfringens]|uniref:hypothetical protein n=1 Tax=Clostridium perfringens TaxID=1502 RepID=UPI0024BBFE3A|nr:hypothetical protein [Clostridium perfringens]MDU8988414.1 hypothetical protein [Clostridium perfringens]